MAIVGGITVREDVPHEPGQQFTLRRLGHAQLAEARERALHRSLRQLRAMGPEGAAAIEQRRAERERGEAETDPWDPANFDREYVLTEGIATWTYEVHVTPANIRNLDEETAEWAFRRIIELSRPPSKADLQD